MIVGKLKITAATFFIRLAVALLIVFLFAAIARAGGPKSVAGSSFFNATTMGQPITWSLGQVNYYTDQGDLSPILPNAAANALVASSFAQWTSVSTAALTATAAGQLAEDVNGANIVADSYGTITAPADIMASATQTPVGIVYDYDGTVTDALLGAGAGDPSQCFWNAVYGGTDNYSIGANFTHALVIINGQCALQTSQLTDVKYRLVRVLGTVLGLSWSQMNLNVITGNPPPTADDYAGFPVMHYIDEFNCIPITVCYSNPYQLVPDDMAALSRLYPAVPTTATARIHGSVYFVDRMGNSAQSMEGVNVVARWIDPSTNLPSDAYGVSSVSGFLFTGNAGNPITGLSDALGNLYSEFGSNSPTVEGFFDLGGLPIPNGAGTVQYQLSVEALDPLWSSGVCPYDPAQVAPSGTFQPIIVTVDAGGDLEQDILMAGSAQPAPSWTASKTWAAPATVPAPGDWVGSLGSYGDVDYFLIPAQANRTFSVAVTALDETSLPTLSKAEPVVGIWTIGDPQGTPPPALTTSPFNSSTVGMSRLDAQIFNTNSFIIGIADLRGDGRPDYHYHAHVLYSDSVIPARVPVAGGAITLQGIGFAPGLADSMGSADLPVFATNSGQMLVAAPAQTDGPQTITVTDPISGAFSIMTDALTVGAASTDQILLLQGGNPSTAAGTQATNPVMVRVVAADGVTPVSGATVGWTTTNGTTLSICSAGTACSSISDESGIASTWVTPAIAGNATVTAALAPGVYSTTKSVSGSITATSTTQDIGIVPNYLWVAQGASVSVAITAQVVDLGKPQKGTTVSFRIAQGSASLSALSAVTGSLGDASVTLTLTNFSSSAQVTACVVTVGGPCQNTYINAVAASLLNLQAVAGAGQIVAGTSFQPLIVRVTDSSTPPNPILGASVVFQSTIMRPLGDGLSQTTGDPSAAPEEAPIILSASQATVQSDGNGMANLVPSIAGVTGTLEIQIQVSAGGTATLMNQFESFPAATGEGNRPVVIKFPVRISDPRFPVRVDDQ